ncbi:MAG: hypothetical protein HYY24_07640 [Verrucomicrobia bacterium]|nr:hypothetical protein [Verrucomicrobiota bacterium]
MLVPLAQRSFNSMLAGAILGGIAGFAATRLGVGRRGLDPHNLVAQPSPGSITVPTTAGRRGLQPHHLVALLGVAVVLLLDATRAFPLKPYQGWGFVVLVLGLAGAVLITWVRMPAAGAMLWRNKDLLVPLGLLTLTHQALAWLTLLPPLARLLVPAWSLSLWNLQFSLSVSFLLGMAVNVAYAAWVTTAIVATARDGRCDLAAAWGGVRRWCWRVLGLEFIGAGVVMLGLGTGIASMATDPPLGVVTIGATALVWNFLTAALLVVALQTEGGFWTAFRAGVAASWANKWKWWAPLLAQLLLLGVVTVIHVKWSDAPGSFKESTNWSINAFWVGGYQEECHWYGKLMEALNQTPKVQLLSTLLALVFGGFAVAVKLHIAQALRLVTPPPVGEPPKMEG